jgi:hypothetical protein
MSWRNRRAAVLAVTATAVLGSLIGLMSVAAGPASAFSVKIPYTFENWAVWGSLTPKKLNEPVVLPKGSTFNGSSTLTSTETTLSGTVTGNIFVPPFNASLKLGGVVPTNVGVTFTEAGPAEGTLVEAPPADCVGARFSGSCMTLSVTTKANIGISEVGLLGINTPTQCETSEPVAFALQSTVTLGEMLNSGVSFAGTVTIPSLTCSGVEGVLVGPLLTSLMSGPENPYSLNLTPHEPGPPTVAATGASLVTQISATMKGTVEPNGYPVSTCTFEYGTTESYEKSTPCVDPPGSGNNVSAALTGLAEGATYHYRVVATNSQGTIDSNDQTFNTLAAAAAPEYGQCVAQKKGNYTEGACLTVSEKKGAPNHKGSFEWVPGPGAPCVEQKKGDYTDSQCTTAAPKPGKGTFEKTLGASFSSTGGAVTLETPGQGSGKVLCTASSATGEVTGTKTGVERLTFTGCESAGKQCTSEGAGGTASGTAGVIETNLLDTRLLGPVATEVGNEVWTELASAEHQPYWAEFGCGGSLFRLTGSLAGAQTEDINAPKAVSRTEFQTYNTEQELFSELSESSGTSWSAATASTLVLVLQNTAGPDTEIKP